MHDVINSFFELFSGLAVILNIKAAYVDKQIKGVRIIPTTFFVIWGYWNIYFYSQVDCLWSLIGGCLLVLTNSIWLFQMFYYRKKR